MLWLAAAAMIATPVPDSAPRITAITVQARATVRIVTAVRLSFGAQHNLDAPEARDTRVASDGELKPARLIEFQ